MTIADVTAIEQEIHIKARPETVYALLTEGDGMATWMGRSVTFEPRPGGLVRIDMNGFDIMRGTVVEAVPYSRLVYTIGWESLDDDAVRPGTSTVAFTLTPDGDGTRVNLVHSGLPELARQPHSEGWGFFMSRLADAAEGRPVEPMSGPLSTGETLASRLNTLLVDAADAIERLPESAWQAPTTAEGWSVAAVANHIAGHLMLAQVADDIAHGRPTPVSEFTIELRDANNAAVAAAFSDPGRAEIIATIRSEGRKAVEAIRALTDEGLNRAANMAFAGGQPVPAIAIVEGPLLADVRSHLDSILAAAG